MKNRVIPGLIVGVVAAIIAVVIYYLVEDRLLFTGLIVIEVILLPILARRIFKVS